MDEHDEHSSMQTPLPSSVTEPGSPREESGSPAAPPAWELPQLPRQISADARLMPRQTSDDAEVKSASPPEWVDLSGVPSDVRLEIRQELELFFQSSLRHEFVNLGARIKQDVRVLLEEFRPSRIHNFLHPNGSMASKGSTVRISPAGADVKPISAGSNAHTSVMDTDGKANSSGSHATISSTAPDVKTQSPHLSSQAEIVRPTSASSSRNGNDGDVVWHIQEPDSSRDNAEGNLLTPNRRKGRANTGRFGPRNFRSYMATEAIDNHNEKSESESRTQMKKTLSSRGVNATRHTPPSEVGGLLEVPGIPMCPSSSAPSATGSKRQPDTQKTTDSERTIQWQGDVLPDEPSHRPVKDSSQASLSVRQTRSVRQAVAESVRTVVAHMPSLTSKHAVDISASSASQEGRRISPEQDQGPTTSGTTRTSALRSSATRSGRVSRKGVFVGGSGRYGSKGIKNAKGTFDSTQTESSWVRKTAEELVQHIGWDIFSATLVFANALWIGVYTELVATHGEDKDNPSGFARGLDLTFSILFVFELAMRIYVYRCQFFTMKGREWNWFDTLVVSFQIAEESMFVVNTATGQGTSDSGGFFRLFPILRLCRVLRLVRLVRLVGELRTIVYSIISTWKSLGWTMVLLTLIIYVVGIFFTTLVLDNASENSELEEKFGSVSISVLSLFGAITGGIDWLSMAEPLIEDCHPFAGVLFSLYIAFSVLAMLNVVTGVFVDSALVTAKRDKDVDLVNTLREVFLRTDEEHTGMIHLPEFEKHIMDSQMDTVFKAIDLDRSEARGLFELIDVENKGEINREEFIMGCLRLKGPAKALDLATLMFDTKRLANMLEEHMGVIDLALGLE